MSSKFYNMACELTASMGAVSPMTLTGRVPSFLTFAEAGVRDGDVLTYSIESGEDREVGRGIYTAATRQLTRHVLRSTANNNLINLSGHAQVSIVLGAEDFDDLNQLQLTFLFSGRPMRDQSAYVPIVMPLMIHENFAGSRVHAAGAWTTAKFSITRNETEIGIITANEGFSSSVSGDIMLDVDDILRVYCSETDATIADVGISLLARRQWSVVP